MRWIEDCGAVVAVIPAPIAILIRLVVEQPHTVVTASEEPLIGVSTRSTGVVSRGAEFLRVPLVSIATIAEASFQVGMELIRYRAEEHDVFAP